MRTVRSLPPSVTIDDVISAGWLGMVEALGRRTPDMPQPGAFGRLARNVRARATTSVTKVSGGSDTVFDDQFGVALVSVESDVRRARMNRVQLEDVAEPLLRAEVSSLAASLRKDQRRFDEAAALLERSLAIYREINDPAKAGAVMLNQASLLFTGGRPLDAARAVEEALTLIDPENEPRLYLCGSHNLATYLCSAGLHARAKESLDAHAELYRRFGDVYAQLRHEWLQGLIEAGLGRPAAAEEALRRVRRGFIERGQGYDAALVTLDLALLYAEQGRHRDVLRLAEQTVPLFAAQDVHREALAALLMFQQAAREEAVTVRLVEQLAARLQQVRYDPRMLAELPS